MIYIFECVVMVKAIWFQCDYVECVTSGTLCSPCLTNVILNKKWKDIVKNASLLDKSFGHKFVLIALGANWLQLPIPPLLKIEFLL